jgi:type VI secretion system protein ImpB
MTPAAPAGRPAQPPRPGGEVNAMSRSIHDKLKRVRPPRVHITYEVETEGAVVEKELPFVVGVLGDFSGDPTSELKPLKDRKFIQIDRDNFNDVMARMTPGLNLRVENTLQGDGSEMAVQLKFNSIEDFEPAAVVNQVEPLRKLLDTRNKLRDLLTKIDRSDELESILEQVLENTEQLKKLSAELGLDASAGAKPSAGPEKEGD